MLEPQVRFLDARIVRMVANELGDVLPALRVEAESEGEIREICVQNGEAIEYGQVLMRVAPR